MSTHDLKVRKHDYLENLREKVNASEFSYFQKDWVEIQNGNIESSGKSNEAIKEFCSSLKYGKSVIKALEIWTCGLNCAINEFKRDITSMEIRDFAYLTQFRLMEEGSELTDYLEWFFGEAIRTYVDENVTWSDQSFADLSDKNLFEPLKGALISRLNPVSKIYDKLRFSYGENRKRNHFKMGDLFIHDSEIRMIISADCDLIPRNDQNDNEPKVKVPRILTVGGVIKEFEDISLDKPELLYELLFKNSISKTIEWEKKDVCSHNITKDCSDDFSKIYDGKNWYNYHATLRPQYAKNIQSKVLGDLSRVGLEVTPPIIVPPVPVSAFIKGKDFKFHKLPEFENSFVSVLFAAKRKNEDKKENFILFQNEYVESLIEWLKNNQDEYKHLTSVQDVLDAEEDFKNCMVNLGLKLSKSGEFGIYTEFQNKYDPVKVKVKWLKFLVDLPKG